MERKEAIKEESTPKKKWSKPELSILDADLTGTGVTSSNEGTTPTKPGAS